MPRAETDPVVVWRYGEALLAASLDEVVEVAPVGENRAASTRHGPVELIAIDGLSSGPEPPRRAIVLRTGSGTVALPASDVEGVVEGAGAVEDPPRWLDRLPARHVKALVRVDGRRTAALLDVDAIQAP